MVGGAALLGSPLMEGLAKAALDAAPAAPPVARVTDAADAQGPEPEAIAKQWLSASSLCCSRLAKWQRLLMPPQQRC